MSSDTSYNEDRQILESRLNFLQKEFNHIDNYGYYIAKKNIWFCEFCGMKNGWSKAYDGFKEIVNHMNKNHFETNPDEVLWLEERFLSLLIAEKKANEGIKARFSKDE